MSDQIRIDSHKLIYHPKRVADWLDGDTIYPIYVEIAPSGTCNHRCIFCAMDYMEYKPVFIDDKALKATLEEMAAGGVKSIMYAGEGEPLLNKRTPEYVTFAKKLGIDVSMTTNGVLFDEDVTNACFSSLSWVRFSINGGNAENYQRIHCSKPNDFNIVLDNLRYMVQYKKEKGLETTIGTQLLLIPENGSDVLELAWQLKEIGVDYFSVKPYSQHPMSGNVLSEPLKYEDYFELENQLKQLEDENFKVFFRSSAMKKLDEGRTYQKCLGLPFWAYIDAKANLWGCSAYLGDENFHYGNLTEASFDQIWKGEKRKKSLAFVADMDTKQCREICRLDNINRYLDELKHPGAHVNFI